MSYDRYSARCCSKNIWRKFRYIALNADKVSKVIQTVEGATSPQVERVSGLPQINVNMTVLV